MVRQSSTYKNVQKKVATVDVITGKGKGKDRRELNERMFPKASLRSFAVKYGAKRLSSTADKGVYELLDSKLYNIIENVICDAAIYTKSAGQTTIKEVDVTRAITRLGGSSLGLASDTTRKRTKD